VHRTIEDGVLTRDVPTAARAASTREVTEHVLAYVASAEVEIASASR
jgi:hypothetical protein